MTTRDRLVVCVLVAAAALAAMWLGVVSPKRNEAAKLGSAVAAEQVQLASAQSQLAQGVAAEGSYKQNLHVVKALYKAVPSTSGVPKLLVALDKTSHHKRVDFQVINVAAAAPTTTPVASTTPARHGHGRDGPGRDAGCAGDRPHTDQLHVHIRRRLHRPPAFHPLGRQLHVGRREQRDRPRPAVEHPGGQPDPEGGLGAGLRDRHRLQPASGDADPIHPDHRVDGDADPLRFQG